MKKVINGGMGIYIQKDDLRLILCLKEKGLLNLPEGYDDVFSSFIIDIDEMTQHEFVKFDNYEIVEFLKKQDWILDYDCIKMSIEEFKMLEMKVNLKVQELLEKDAKYNEEYNKSGANQELINQEIINLNKILIPMMLMQSMLSSEYLTNLRYGGLVELEIPTGLVPKK